MQRKKILYDDIFASLRLLGWKELMDFFVNQFMANKTDVSELVKEFDKFNSLLLELDSFVIIADVTKVSWLYVSPSSKQILGYNNIEMQNKGGMFLLDVFCPPDKKASRDYLLRINEHHKKCELSQKSRCTYNTTFRLFHKKGYYKWFHNNWRFTHHNKNGKPLISVSILTDIDQFKTDDSLDLIISKHKPETNTHEIEYKEKQLPMGMADLKPVETKILKLLAEGDNNATIANELQLKESTIKDYRKKMLNKTMCSNTAELIYQTLRNNII